MLPFASSPAASGRALATLLVDGAPVPSGAYVDHRLRQRPASQQARDVAYGDAVLADSRHLLAGTAGESVRDR